MGETSDIIQGPIDVLAFGTAAGTIWRARPVDTAACNSLDS